MSQEPAEIKAHIKAEGENLKENFEEIESRMKDALDWRVWYSKNTALALGSVAAGGLLLSLLVPKTRSVESDFVEFDDEMDGPEVEMDGRAQLRSTPKSASRFRQVADNTMAAVLGVAADKFQDFMARALPGFREHYTDAQQRRKFD